MKTFSQVQQIDARKSFMEECRNKAWSAACHADWIAHSLEPLMADYKRLQEEDHQLEADIKELEKALDNHTVDNRNKRKSLQERRNEIARQMQGIAQHAQQGQKAMEQLLQSVEASIALAKHAEEFEWKEVEAAAEQPETV